MQKIARRARLAVSLSTKWRVSPYRNDRLVGLSLGVSGRKGLGTFGTLSTPAVAAHSRFRDQRTAFTTKETSEDG